MSVSPFVQEIIEEQRNKVLALTDPTVIETAMKLSFYVAMLDAAIYDPLDDEKDQKEMLALFTKNVKELTEEYQKIVNDLL